MFQTSSIPLWTALAALAGLGQVAVLIVTARFVWRYLQETTELRRAAERQVGAGFEQVEASLRQLAAMNAQVDASRGQATAALSQLEAQIRPALTVVDQNTTFWVVNVGSGAALNLELVRTSREPIDSEAESNFGRRIRGASISPGQSQAQDTGELVGSIGTLRDERLHLIYESLSGKKYASVITFEGSGRPVKTRLVARA